MQGPTTQGGRGGTQQRGNSRESSPRMQSGSGNGGGGGGGGDRAGPNGGGRSNSGNREHGGRGRGEFRPCFSVSLTINCVLPVLNTSL